MSDRESIDRLNRAHAAMKPFHPQTAKPKVSRSRVNAPKSRSVGNLSSMHDTFPTWKIRFTDRAVFNRAVEQCSDCDVGHSDMVFTFADREEFNANRVGLCACGITEFTTENPEEKT